MKESPDFEASRIVFDKDSSPLFICTPNILGELSPEIVALSHVKEKQLGPSDANPNGPKDKYFPDNLFEFQN